MIASAFDMGEMLTLKTIEYKLHPPLWNKYDLSAIDFNFEHWTTFKYLNVASNGLNNEVENVPNNTGGLYLFFVKCPVIIGMTEYPFYIGRSQFTPHQNLRKRCKEYYQKYRLNNERPKITKMFKYWEKELYFAYYPLNDNNEIKDYEKKLINSLLLPMNDEIPDQETREAVNAF